MDAKAYLTRLELLATATTWNDANPYRAIAIARLESPGLAFLGGPYAPSTGATDRSVMASESAVELMREYPTAVTESVQEF